MHINIAKTSIINIFVMPAHDENTTNSPFQGFTSNIFHPGYHDALRRHLTFPMNATEVYMSHDELIKYRCEVAVSSRLLINANSLIEALKLFEGHPFIFITCIGKELEFVRSLNLKFKYPPLIVGPDGDVDVNISEYNIFSLDDLIIERFHTAIKNGDVEKDYSKYIKGKKPRGRVLEVLDIPSRCHAITNPNEVTLLSLGYDFKETNRLLGNSGKKVFIDAMIESGKYFNNKITHRKDDQKSDLIVYSPSMFTHLYDFKKDFWVQLGKKIKHKAAKNFIMDSVFKNPNYSGISLRLKSEEKLNKIMRNKTVSMLLQTRKHELAYSTLAMESLAVIYACPAVRLPNAVNFHSSKLKELETLSTSSNDKAMENLNRKYKLLSKALKNEIGNELVEFIAESESLTICSDAPIEWVTFKKIPLMFTHEISKIHTTPGNQLLKTTANFSNITLEHEDILKVTVIRSFKDNDPIRNTLAIGLQTFAEIDNQVELIIVDVDSREQLIRELNNVKTAILIFDCHGNHGGSDSNGWLQIGDDKVDTWNLPCKGSIPPIVILSACLTSAVGGSHASVANGLLALGAQSVLGTLLPVDANRSSAFVGRIILRLTGFINAIRKMGVSYLTWRKFISDYFKMSFCTDILIEFRHTYGCISDEEYNEIHLEVNKAINMFKPDWFEILVHKVAESSGNDRDTVQRTIDEIGFVETMNYLQIGRPENIIIHL